MQQPVTRRPGRTRKAAPPSPVLPATFSTSAPVPEKFSIISELTIEGVPRLPGEPDVEYVARAEVALNTKYLSGLDIKALRALESVLAAEEAPAAIVAAAREILTRTRGKPVDHVEVSGPGGGPIQTAHVTDEQIARFINRHAKQKADAPDADGS